MNYGGEMGVKMKNLSLLFHGWEKHLKGVKMKNTFKKTMLLIMVFILFCTFFCIGADTDLTGLPEMQGTLILKLNFSQAVVDNSLVGIDADIAVVPFTENDRTLVPLRFVSEAFFGEVEWIEATQTITIEIGETVLFFQIDNNTMYNGDVAIQLDAPPRIYNSRTLVPLRALAEALGKNVSFEDGWIVITGNKVNWENLASSQRYAIYNSIMDGTFVDVGGDSSSGSGSFVVPPNSINDYFKGNPLSENAYLLNGTVVFPSDIIGASASKKFNDELKAKKIKLKRIQMPLVLSEDDTLYALGVSDKKTVTMTMVAENIADFDMGQRFAIILRKDGIPYTKTGYKLNQFIPKSINILKFDVDIKDLHGRTLRDLRGQVKSVYAGRECCFIIKNDGTLWAWGSNLKGKLGDGTQTDRPDPVEIKGIPDPQFIVSAINHTLCIDKDGYLWGWGENAEYELTNEFGKITTTPKRFTGISDVKYVATAADYTIAVKKDGTVWVAGDNDRGKLGVHTIRRALEWTQIPELKDAVYSNANDYHYCNGNGSVVTRTGDMYCWGTALPTKSSIYSKLNDIKPIKLGTNLDVSKVLD